MNPIELTPRQVELLNRPALKEAKISPAITVRLIKRSHPKEFVCGVIQKIAPNERSIVDIYVGDDESRALHQFQQMVDYETDLARPHEVA